MSDFKPYWRIRKVLASIRDVPYESAEIRDAVALVALLVECAIDSEEAEAKMLGSAR